METAEHREPYEPRGSRTDLGAPRGESPLGDSTTSSNGCNRPRRASARSMAKEGIAILCMARSSRWNFLSVTSVGSRNRLCAEIYPLSFAVKARRLRSRTIHAHGASFRTPAVAGWPICYSRGEQPSAQPQGAVLHDQQHRLDGCGRRSRTHFPPPESRANSENWRDAVWRSLAG